MVPEDAVVADFWSSWKKLESGMELFYPYSLIVKGLKCSCKCGLWAILDRKIFRVSREMLGGGASDLSIEIEPGSTSFVWLTLIDSHSWLACVMCSWGSTELGGNKWGRHSWACVGHCICSRGCKQHWSQNQNISVQICFHFNGMMNKWERECFYR